MILQSLAGLPAFGVSHAGDFRELPGGCSSAVPDARVVLDPANRSVPQSALAGVRENGSIDVAAIMKSLMRRPQDLGALFRLAGDSRKANRALFRSRQALGPLFGFHLLKMGEFTLNVE